MEYLAKIVGEQKSENGNFWKYDFLDLQTNQEDWFYSAHRIRYAPYLSGKLHLDEEERPKLFQSFKQDTGNIAEDFKHLEALIPLEKEWKKGIKKVDRDFTKRRGARLAPQEIVQAKKEKITQKQLASIYGKSERTIRNWKKDKHKRKTGRKEKICGKTLLLLCWYVLQNSGATQWDMADYLHQEVGQWFSQPTICRTLRKIKLTYQVIPNNYSERIPLLSRARKQINKLKKLPSASLLALDESGYKLNLVRRRGWGLKGQKIDTDRPGKQGTNHTLILLTRNIVDGVVHHELIKEKVDTKTIYDFLEKAELPPLDTPYYLLLDNARIHYANRKRKELGLPSIEEQLAKKNIRLEYLTPYFPQLNPAEKCFNIIRQKLEKSRSWTEEDLRTAVDRVMKDLRKQDLTKYFQKCLDYFD